MYAFTTISWNLSKSGAKVDRVLSSAELRRPKASRGEFLALPRRPITVVLDSVVQNYNYRRHLSSLRCLPRRTLGHLWHHGRASEAQACPGCARDPALGALGTGGKSCDSRGSGEIGRCMGGCGRADQWWQFARRPGPCVSCLRRTGVGNEGRLAGDCRHRRCRGDDSDAWHGEFH